MAKIGDGTLKDFTDGEYLKANDLDQVLEIIRTAINDNYDKVITRYTKLEVDTLLSNMGAGVANSIQIVSELPTNGLQGKFVLKSPENIVYYDTGTVWKEFLTAAALTAAVETLTSADSTIAGDLSTHTARTDNPHAVTAGQISAIHTNQKGIANGVPSLDANTELPMLQIPRKLIFGDGSDGDVTITGNTQLPRNMFYNNLTINNGVTLSPVGYKIFVLGTLTNNGTIDNSGGNGGDGGSFGNGAGDVAGGLPGIGGGGGGWSSNAGSSGSHGGTGGTGGISSTSSAGGTGGGNSNSFASVDKLIHTLQSTTSGGGAGGGGGGTGASSGVGGSGGGGGGGGGRIHIHASKLVNSGTIQSKGGNGGTGYNYNASYKGAGGGGGGGGFVLIVTRSFSGNNPVVTGGTGGSNAGGGLTGGNGNNGISAVYTLT